MGTVKVILEYFNHLYKNSAVKMQKMKII